MSGKLQDQTSFSPISRQRELAVAVDVRIDSAVHSETETLRAGTLLGLKSGGKHRAYAQAGTDSDFSNASPNFDLKGGDKAAKHFRVGDVIEGTDGTALGTIATYNTTTGVGTLTGNAANNLSGEVRVLDADLKISGKDGAVLQFNQRVREAGLDLAVAAWKEGFFKQSSTSITAEAITTMGATQFSADEVRLV